MNEELLEEVVARLKPRECLDWEGKAVSESEEEADDFGGDGSS